MKAQHRHSISDPKRSTVQKYVKLKLKLQGTANDNAAISVLMFGMAVPTTFKLFCFARLTVTL